MSAALTLPSEQRRGGPEARRRALALLWLAVLMLHLWLLQAMVGSRQAGTVQAPAGPLLTSVRSIPLTPPAPARESATGDEAAATALAAPEPSRTQATAKTPSIPAPAASPAQAQPAPLEVAAAPTPAAAPPGVATSLPAGEPLPNHRPELPPPFEARFEVQRGALSGQATLAWRANDAGYHLSLQTQVLGRELSHLRSTGRLGAAGLEPLRFVDGRRGRDQRAVNFRRDEPGGDRISFSGPATELALPVGVQDRLSWLLQLAAIADSDPELRQPGRELAMWVVGPRGDADIWTFVVTGTPRLTGTDGQERPTLALRREARRAWDTEVEVWLDPAARHLPLRARWRTVGAGDDSGVDLWRQGLEWQRPP